jgi:hypothetical protein
VPRSWLPTSGPGWGTCPDSSQAPSGVTRPHPDRVRCLGAGGGIQQPRKDRQQRIMTPCRRSARRHRPSHRRLDGTTDPNALTDFGERSDDLKFPVGDRMPSTTGVRPVFVAPCMPIITTPVQVPASDRDPRRSSARRGCTERILIAGPRQPHPSDVPAFSVPARSRRRAGGPPVPEPHQDHAKEGTAA